MSNQEWWAAERKAAEFWRKVRENHTGSSGGNTLKHDKVTVPGARIGQLARRSTDKFRSSHSARD